MTLQDGWSRNWHCVKLAPGQRLSRGQGIIEPSGELRRIMQPTSFTRSSVEAIHHTGEQIQYMKLK